MCNDDNDGAWMYPRIVWEDQMYASSSISITPNVLYNVVLPEGFCASISGSAVKIALYHGALHRL